MNPLRIAAGLVLACTALALTAAPALADTTVAGSGEPATTKASTNTWWFTSTPTSGTDARRVCIDFYANGSPVASDECINLPADGTHTFWFQRSNLQHGSTYSACAQEHYSFPNDSLFFPAGPEVCSTTRIDTGKPNVGLTLAGGAEYTNDATVPVRIGYQDSLSPPWSMDRSDPDASAANFLCAADPGGCSNGFAYDESCSVPEVARPGSLNGIFQNAFNCERDLSARADGPAIVCAIAADGAMPDNPQGHNQFNGQASQANLSDSACDQVVLDRGAPSLSLGGSRRGTPGAAISLTADASDTLSGVAEEVKWTFGDGAQAEGASVSHAYATPGTYVVEAKARDRAGNVKVEQATVTVMAPAGGGGGGNDSGSGGGTGGNDSGGSGGSPQGAASLAVLAKRKLRLRARPRSLRVAVSPSGPGTVEVKLQRGRKLVSRGVDLFRGAGSRSLQLRLPRRLAAGSYRLTATFLPKSGAPVKRTLAIRFVR